MDTTALLFGRALCGIEDYEEWLFGNMPKRRMVVSRDNKKKILLPGYSIPKRIPQERIISQDFLSEAGKMKIERFPQDIRSLGREVSSIALFSGESMEGRSLNNLESNFFLNLSSSYRTLDCFFAKNCGCEIYSSFTENSFGCFLALYSNFVVNCYYSTNLSACFEMDGCRDCNGSMFCHNCEGLRDCMFCFNTRSKRYAVGNLEVGRQKYLGIKGELQRRMLDELEGKKSLELSIYNVLCR